MFLINLFSFNNNPQTTYCHACCVDGSLRTLCLSEGDRTPSTLASGIVTSYNWRRGRDSLLSAWTGGWCPGLAWFPLAVGLGWGTPSIPANPCLRWYTEGWRKCRRCTATVDCTAHGGPPVWVVPLCGVWGCPNRTICRTKTVKQTQDGAIKQRLTDLFLLG